MFRTKLPRLKDVSRIAIPFDSLFDVQYSILVTDNSLLFRSSAHYGLLKLDTG